jgi:RimJ/RimL family protein N-acetyltransferase
MGVWLGRSFRGSGVGTAALALVLAEARHAGLSHVVANTTAGNVGARRLLGGAGAHLTHDGDGNVPPSCFPTDSHLTHRTGVWQR